MPVCADFLRY